MPKEAAIQREIMDYLEHNRVLFWRVPVGPVMHGGMRKKNPLAGMPDIMFHLPGSTGKMGFIEIKRPGSKPRKDQAHQLEVHKQLRRANFLVIDATNLQDVRYYLDFHLKAAEG